MKSFLSLKLVYIVLLLIILPGCKKAGEEVIENIGKKITKEGIETSTEAATKGIIKSLTKKEIEYAIIENGLSKDVLKTISKHLSNQEASLFINESKIIKSSITKFNNNPDLIIAYKKLFKSESHRTNIVYLDQTENWIKNGSKGLLILKIQSSNVENKLIGKVQNDIPFIERIVRSEGLTFSGFFPDFIKYNIYSAPKLESVFLKSSDKIQFSICRANFRKEFEQNPKKIEKLLMIQNKRFAANGGILSKGRYITDPQEMLKKQIKDIKQIHSGNQKERIFGFEWHHNENNGIIDLIAYDKHNSVKHIGGRNIWGGGSVARK